MKLEISSGEYSEDGRLENTIKLEGEGRKGSGEGGSD
jgi:hypothetical protein